MKQLYKILIIVSVLHFGSGVVAMEAYESPYKGSDAVGISNATVKLMHQQAIREEQARVNTHKSNVVLFRNSRRLQGDHVSLSERLTGKPDEEAVRNAMDNKIKNYWANIEKKQRSLAVEEETELMKKTRNFIRINPGGKSALSDVLGYSLRSKEVADDIFYHLERNNFYDQWTGEVFPKIDKKELDTGKVSQASIDANVQRRMQLLKQGYALDGRVVTSPRALNRFNIVANLSPWVPIKQ